MKYYTVIALILITLPSSITRASSDSIDCSRLSEYLEEIDKYNSQIKSANSDIQSASEDQALISSIYPLIDKIEELENGNSQESAGFLQTSSYETASALTLSLASLGDEVIDDKITTINEEMKNYTEAGSDVDRLELINRIRTSLKELDEEISEFIAKKNLEIESYTTSIGQLSESLTKCANQQDDTA